MIDHSKYSSNALFGVDVCSVWKRAIAHCNSRNTNKNNSRCEKDDNNLAPPFEGHE